MVYCQLPICIAVGYKIVAGRGNKFPQTPLKKQVQGVIDIRQKSKQINFRVSEKEYEQIQKRAVKSNLPISTFLIKSALNKEIIIINDIDILCVELRKIGNNLNQIAKLYNQGYITTYNFDDTNKEIHEIWQQLNLLTQKVV